VLEPVAHAAKYSDANMGARFRQLAPRPADEYLDVGRVSSLRGQRITTGMGRICRVTGLGQGIAQTIGKFEVIFDEQEAHEVIR
jgi:hypothetical protein